MKRFLPFAVVLLTLAQPTMALALAGGPTLTAQVSSATVAVGSQFTVTVQMDTKTYSVSAAEIHMSFPADKIQGWAATTGTFLPSELAHSIGPAEATLTAGSGSTAKQGSGPVAIFTFRALAPGTVQIGFGSGTQVAAVGQSSNAVGTMTPVTVTITGSGTAPSSTPPAGYTYTPTPPADWVRTPTPTPTGIGGVAQVATGPGETTILALIVGSIITLLYVGYTGSDAFRRNEAVSYSKESKKKAPNFKK